MNKEQPMIHEHVTMKECMLYLNSKFLIPTTEQFETLSPIISKLSDCPTCRAICHEYKELGQWLESELKLAEETTADVTDTLTENILSYIERAKQAAQELGNKMIESLFVQPQLVPVVTRTARDNDAESERADIVIHDVGDGFFSFVLEKEMDMSMRIQDFNINEIPQLLKEDHTAVKLIMQRIDDKQQGMISATCGGNSLFPVTSTDGEQQDEISLGVLHYKLSPAQISFQDVRLPAGNYIFYLTRNEDGSFAI